LILILNYLEFANYTEKNAEELKSLVFSSFIF